MQEEFNTNDDFCWYGIKVTNVSITKIEGNQYKAFVDIEYMGGKKKMVGADVWVNSSHYHYEFPAGTFLFLMFE
jgi:hypothetical protein